MTERDRTAADRHAVHRQRNKKNRTKETNWIDPSLRMCPVNLCGSRTYIVMTRLASCSLIAAFLLVAGCHHHHYRDDDDGWRDGDRDYRHHSRYDRDDDRRYRDRDYR
jgi:hypothetical protein